MTPQLSPIAKAIPRSTPGVVVTSWNPLKPDVREVRPSFGQTIAELAPATQLPFIALRNGEPVMRADWATTRINDGDVLVFQMLPQGGGGGASRQILSIVVMVAAIALGQFFAPQFVLATGAAFGSASTTAAILTAGFAILGNLLLNALIPLPKPGTNALADIASPSPTYNVSAQGNQARIEQPIPVIYGRHLIFPDFAAQPYQEFIGGEQFYYALFCIGQGEYNIEKIAIDDTPVENFQDVTTQIVPPGGSQTLVQTNVVNAPEVSGQDMLSDTYIGPFSASGPGQPSSQIGIDIVMPKGLYFANDNGSLASKTINWRVEARLIDDYDTPITGQWIVLATESYTAATTTPPRLTYTYNVTSGRYQVRVIRLDQRDDNARAGHDIAWGSMRAYLTNAGVNNTTATFMAVKIRASEQLSGLSQRRFSLIVRRKLPIYDEATSTWSAPQETRSIIWAFADALRNTTYGAGISESRIDMPMLLALDSIYASRGDYFDAVFDSKLTIWEALTQIARTGRAVPLLRSGVVTLIRDQQRLLPVALYTNRNIARGSLSIDYVTASDDTPDGVEVTYFDALAWNQKRVTAAVPGVTTPAKPAKVQMFGVTGATQAQREARYIAANSVYRRKFLKFTTEMEGYIPAYGDLIAVSHDMPSWGVAGDVTAWDSATSTLTLSEPVEFTPGSTHYIALMRPNGSVSGPYEVAAGATADQVVLAGGLDFDPQTDGNRERTKFSFGVAGEFYTLCRVTGIAPRTVETVEISAVAEDDRVHEADADLVPVFTSGFRTGAYAPDNIPNYDGATIAQRQAYAFYAFDSGLVGSVADRGFVYASD